MTGTGRPAGVDGRATRAHAIGQAGRTCPSLSDGLDGFRLILHVLAATIWVGGQFTVAGLLPTVRTLGRGRPEEGGPGPRPGCCGRPTPCW